ncbi:MAG: GAF domain-containing protein [Chloroflexi bacterium]|nr:GAF domain-containing protein [Chloroflexota bacterium]MCC6897016.1 GAF domain-containing protein [Anaerolineae bacterium]
MVNGSKKPTILIVDDIPDTVQLLRDWLESHEFNAIGVTSSLEALDIAEEQKPDLILLDIMMPKMDGMETCRRLKANPRTSSIPVVIVTAKNPSDARAEGMMAGAVDYITKPVNLTDLIKRIETVLSTTTQEPADVQRLLEEVAHSALTIMPSDMVWLLGVDSEEQVLKSRILATTGGARVETEFLLTAANGQSVPKFPLSDNVNPFCSTLATRKMLVNLTTDSLKDDPLTAPIFRATELLRLNYLTVVPLTAAGKTPGVMVLGDLQPHDMETPRARQILTSLGTQAAIALDYSRLISDLTQRENDMRREQAFRQMILDTMSDGLVVIDSKGTISYINRRFLRMTNYPKGYLEGRSVGELFHPDDRVEVMVGLLREGIATMKFEQRLITRENRVIPVWLTRSRAQSEDLQVIVLSDMTEQKRREDELERQTGRLLALNQAAHTITANLSLHETLRNILNSARKVVEAEGASLFLINKDNPDELIVVAADGTGSDILQGLRVPVGEGVAGYVAREAKSQLVGDAELEPRHYKGVDEQTGLSTHALIAVPLINADRVIGVLEVVNKLNESYFTQDDVHLLESMAGTAAVSIVNARLFDETQRRVNELATILNASGAASSTLQFSQVLEGIARNLSDGLEVGRCTIMSWNMGKKRLEPLAEIGDSTWTAETAPKRDFVNEPFVQIILENGSMVHASTLEADLLPEHRIRLEETGMVSIIAQPISLGGNIVGAATLYSNNPRVAFSDEDTTEVNAIVEMWQQNISSTSLFEVDAAQIDDLVTQLIRVQHACWITIRAWQPGDAFTYLLREKGFAEWTKRPGTALEIENYPTMQAVIEHQEARMGSRIDVDQDSSEVEWLLHHGGQSYLAVPLIERGSTVGIVKLVSQEERQFDDDEIRLAQGIANVVSSAMENARLYQSLDSRARALESAYKELQEADKAKDEFIQNVSHELRTPLISVIGYGGLLQEGEFGPINEEQREALGTILQKSQKLADIVQDIVSVQALETQTFNRQQANLVSIVTEVLNKYKDKAQESGLRFNLRVSSDMPSVMVDPKSIADVFEKLLDNAIKFGSIGGVVDVVLQDTNGAVVQVAIRDYGIGIDPSEHQKIFRRFYQVDGGTARRYSGTGLGLAIAKAIVEGHGGRIGVKSSLNDGATFVFTVPKDSAF